MNPGRRTVPEVGNEERTAVSARFLPLKYPEASLTFSGMLYSCTETNTNLGTPASTAASTAAMVASPQIRSISPTVPKPPMQEITTAAPGRVYAQDSELNTSAATHSTLSTHSSEMAGAPDLLMLTTDKPCWVASLQIAEPTNPLPPSTTTLAGGKFSSDFCPTSLKTSKGVSPLLDARVIVLECLDDDNRNETFLTVKRVICFCSEELIVATADNWRRLCPTGT
mmetsp:Transcript_32152/g.44585  ORF Transcript_32152/g.44585 Transcript_32152/m.44585 type:complete len:225 (-) Transcript_32152:130-804(-)